MKASDIKNGAIRGADIKAGTIEADDLAGNATDDFSARLEEPPGRWRGGHGVGGPQHRQGHHRVPGGLRGVNAFGSLAVSPGSVGVQGIELMGEDQSDTTKLFGAATVTRDSPAQPVGGVGFGGGEASMVHLTFHYVTPTKRVLISVDVLLCSVRGGIHVDHLVEDSTPPLPATPGARRAPAWRAALPTAGSRLPDPDPGQPLFPPLRLGSCGISSSPVSGSLNATWTSSEVLCRWACA